MSGGSRIALWKYADITTGTTGVAQQATTEGPNVFLNPARDKSFFSANTPVDAAIYSAEGRLMLAQKGARSMDVSTLSAGLYFIALKGGQTSIRVVRRFVKE